MFQPVWAVFDDRQSLERARHEQKKSTNLGGPTRYSFISRSHNVLWTNTLTFHPGWIFLQVETTDARINLLVFQAPGNYTRADFSFLAHAMRARGSDGHQNVLWSVIYSQVVREQVKCKKPDVFRMQKQNKPRNTNTNQTRKKGRHPVN